MSKILVNDLKELAKQKNDTETIQYKDFSITVKQYLSMTEKIGLVSSIYNSAIDEDDELQILNYNALDIAYVVLVTKAYTDVSLPKDNISAYDLLISSGLYYKIYQLIPLEERLELEKVLDNFIDEKQERYKRENTLPNIVKSALSGLIDKIPSKEEAEEFIKNASEELNNLNPDNFKFVQDFLKANRGEK